MTITEFVEAYSRGLQSALHASFSREGDIHIEDLMAWTATYADNAFQFLSSMPVETRERPNQS